MAGFFRVYPEPDDPGDIRFEQIELEPGQSVTDDQLQLRDDAHHALTILRSLFPSLGPKFTVYFNELLSLARLGLVGASANPVMAARVLSQLKAQILLNETPRIKNGYMRRLGGAALTISGAAILLRLVIFCVTVAEKPYQVTLVDAYFLVWLGSMAGAWLSFSVRNVALTFDQLATVEEDAVEPLLRLVGVGMLAEIVAMAVASKVFSISVGAADLAAFTEKPALGLLLGIFCGLSEKVLGAKISQQAATFLSGMK